MKGDAETTEVQDHECVKESSASLVEENGVTGATKKRKFVYVNLERGTLDMTKKKKHCPDVIASNEKSLQALSRGQKMVTAANRFRRPDIPLQTNKMFSKSLTVKSTAKSHLRKRLNSDPMLVREIDRSLFVKISEEPIGCGTFGECFLAWYHGDIKAVIKEIKRRDNSLKESRRCKLEVLHEASILHSLGDHAGLPFLLGKCTEQEPYCLVLKFHGFGEESLTLHKVIKRRSLNKAATVSVFQAICNTLQYIHGKGFIHNDLKSNNVLLKREQDSFHPIIIDFGKSSRIEEAKGYKRSSGADYLAPEVRRGEKESLASDIFSLGKMLEGAVHNRSFERVFSNIVLRTTTSSPALRPSVGEIIIQLANAVKQ